MKLLTLRFVVVVASCASLGFTGFAADLNYTSPQPPQSAGSPPTSPLPGPCADLPSSNSKGVKTK